MRAYTSCRVAAAFIGLGVAAAAGHAEAQDGLSPYTRITLGLEQTGASAASSASTFLVDFNLTGPLLTRKMGDVVSVPQFSAVGDFRFNSVSQTGAIAVKDVVRSLSSRPGDLNITEIAQGLRFGIGGEYTLGLAGGFGRFRRPGGDETALSHLAPSVFFTYGATTPLSPVNRIQVHRFDATVKDQLTKMPSVPDEYLPLQTLDPAVIKNIAFITADRDRFYHHAYVGFRLKTYDIRTCETNARGKVDNPCEREILSTRGTIDLGWGFDEELTGGKQSWRVLMLSAFYRLPQTDLFVFGDVRMHHKSAPPHQPLIMKAPDAINVPSADTAILPVPERDRDVWKLGLGVDLIPLLTR